MSPKGTKKVSARMMVIAMRAGLSAGFSQAALICEDEAALYDEKGECAKLCRWLAQLMRDHIPK